MCVDYDPPDVYRETTRTAAMPHRCDECQRTINPGERYLIVAGLSDGSWWGAKQCSQCRAASEWLRVICNGFLYHDVQDELEQHLEEPPPISSVALGRLYVRMRKDWKRRDGSLWPVEDIEALVCRALEPWQRWREDLKGAVQ